MTYIWNADMLTGIIVHQPTRVVYTAEVDQLGSPFQVRTLAGKVVWRWNTEAFGNTLPNEDVDGDGNKLTLNLRFPGQYYDKESGLHYNWHRYYSPKLARYLSPDPIGLLGGMNRFGYVGGNPLAKFDPLGLDWVYSQSTGQMTHVDSNGNSTNAGAGYAGQNAGLNNPANQSVSGTGPNSNGGPLPQGTYDIGTGHYSSSTGPNTMNLTPQSGTDMYGRDLFRIHGDNSAHNNTASEGCVVIGPNVRSQINNSSDRLLRVVP